LAKKAIPVETPLMKQYNSIKAKHPDAILLFRVGDFYETFGEDAIRASEILGITLTRRANGSASFVELAGFPHHAVDNYLPKLVRAGQRVAICEQLEDPKLTKKIVKRGIIELVTPGVSLNENVLEHKENNFLAAVHIEHKIIGLALLDISTGEFLTAEGNYDYIDQLIGSFQPKEILIEKSKQQIFAELFGSKFLTYKLDDWVFTEETALDRLLKHFETSSLKGFGVQEYKYGVIASGAILQYLDLTQHTRIQHITSLSRIEGGKYIWLDKFTIRNLELFRSLNEGAKTLVDVLDQTVSPMGSRMMKRWIAMPLKEIKSINERHEIVDYFIKHNAVREEIEEQIRQIGDIERLISKVAVGRVNPREVWHIKNALFALDPVIKVCEASGLEPLKNSGGQLDPCVDIREKINKELINDPPNQVNKGMVIATGTSEELDELRKLLYSGKDYLVQLQQREIERTQITSLKIGFNNVFGYYIEVRNTHKDKVPPEWIRKQTLVSAERYITEELKEYETKILGAEEKILKLESELFSELVQQLSNYIPVIQQNAALISKLDCLNSFAVIAKRYLVH
jgi:DNA mismatch repair protein MutS